MKKLVLTTVASLACVAAFAQGKVSFQNDSLHLVYYANGSLGGSPVNADTFSSDLLANAGGLIADLYMGTSSSQLFLYSSTTFGTTSGIGLGKFNSLAVQATANATTGAPLILGGTPVFVEVQIRDANKAAPNTFTGDRGANYAYGASSMFNFTLSGTSVYTPLWNQTAGNWQFGTWNMDASVTPGARGAIGVVIVPEPATFALAGLGAAGLLIFRRRR